MGPHTLPRENWEHREPKKNNYFPTIISSYKNNYYTSNKKGGMTKMPFQYWNTYTTCETYFNRNGSYMTLFQA